MANPQSLTFKQLVLDPQTLQPIYSTTNKDLVLCEVYTGIGNSTRTIYITLESLSIIGVLPEHMLSREDVISSILSQGEDESDEEYKLIEGNHLSGYIWSSIYPTREDNEAVEELLKLVTSQKYSDSLKAPPLQSYKVWQQICADMKESDFLIAKNVVLGGQKCEQMWNHLQSEFYGIEEAFKSNTVNNRKRKLMCFLKNKQKDDLEPLPNTNETIEKQSDLNELENASEVICNKTAVGNDNKKDIFSALVHATQFVKDHEAKNIVNIDELGEEEKVKHMEKLRMITVIEDYLSNEAKKRKMSDK